MGAQISKTNKAQGRIPAPRVSGFCGSGSWIPGLLDASSKDFYLFGPTLLEKDGFWIEASRVLALPRFETQFSWFLRAVPKQRKIALDFD